MTPCHLAVSLPPVLVPPVSLAWHQLRFVPLPPWPAAPLCAHPLLLPGGLDLPWSLFPFLQVAWLLERGALPEDWGGGGQEQVLLEVRADGKRLE